MLKGFRSLLDVGVFFRRNSLPDEGFGLKDLHRIMQNYVVHVLHCNSASEWHFTPPKWWAYHPSRNTMSWCRQISRAHEDLSAMEDCWIALHRVRCQIWIMHWHLTPTSLYLSFCCVCTDRIDSHIIHRNVHNGWRLETFAQWEKRTWISTHLV